MSKFGRYAVAEPPSALRALHFHDPGVKLKEVDHEPKVAVLDQEDLLAQGIDVSTFIEGAAKGIDALGSCTANTTIEALSRILSPTAFAKAVDTLGGLPDTEAVDGVYTDTVSAERAAIGFYHACTDQSGDPSQEWPPTDCGSSGPYVVQLLEHLGLVTGQRIAQGADNIVSLMQADGLLVGMPYLNDWMAPDSAGFVDGDGTVSTLQRQIEDGVAGGHEIYFSAVEKVALLPTGHVDPFKTVIRFRNSWTKGWGDRGSARFHLSTVVALGNQVDLRQLVA